MSSTASAAGQHEVFISYVSEDQELCLHVTDFLCHIGVSYYVDFDPNNRYAGNWRVRLSDAISAAKVLLVLWTVNFANKENNQALVEIEIAKEREKKLLPLWFDNARDPSDFLHKEMRGQDGIEFFGKLERADPHEALYAMLRNSKIAVRQPKPEDLSRFTEKLRAQSQAVLSKQAMLSNVPVKLPGVPPPDPPQILPDALAGWCGGTDDCWKQLLGVTPQDDAVAELVCSGALSEASSACGNALRAGISFEKLRLGLLCNLAAAAGEGQRAAAARAMACIVALRHSPGLASRAAMKWNLLCGILTELENKILARYGDDPIEDGGEFTLREHQGFEDEVATVVQDGGGVIVQVEGRPISFAFGPLFAASFDVNHSLERRALAIPSVQQIFAFSPELGMGTYLYLQGDFERMLQTVGKALAAAASSGSEGTSGRAGRILADGALGVIESNLTPRLLETGEGKFEQIQQALGHLRLMKERGFWTSKDQASLLRILSGFADSLGGVEVSEWLRKRLTGCLTEFESLGIVEVEDLCSRLRREMGFSAAHAAFRRSEFDRAWTLLQPELGNLGELPNQGLEVLFRTLARLALRDPQKHVALLKSLLEEQQRRTGQNAEWETMRDIVENIESLKKPETGAELEEELRCYRESDSEGQFESLTSAAISAVSRYGASGDAAGVREVLRKLPDAARPCMEPLLIDLMGEVAGPAISREIGEYLLAGYHGSTPAGETPEPGAIQPPDPARFAGNYGRATPTDRIALGAQLRRGAREIFARRGYSEAVAYLADVGARLPGDGPLSELVTDLAREWAVQLESDPEMREQFQRAATAAVTVAAPRIDVQMPEPSRAMARSASRIDPEREVVLGLLEKLDARDRGLQRE